MKDMPAKFHVAEWSRARGLNCQLALMSHLRIWPKRSSNSCSKSKIVFPIIASWDFFGWLYSKDIPTGPWGPKWPFLGGNFFFLTTTTKKKSSTANQETVHLFTYAGLSDRCWIIHPRGRTTCGCIWVTLLRCVCAFYPHQIRGYFSRSRAPSRHNGSVALLFLWSSQRAQSPISSRIFPVRHSRWNFSHPRSKFGNTHTLCLL